MNLTKAVIARVANKFGLEITRIPKIADSLKARGILHSVDHRNLRPLEQRRALFKQRLALCRSHSC
jgi:hypothetical protein